MEEEEEEEEGEEEEEEEEVRSSSVSTARCHLSWRLYGFHVYEVVYARGGNENNHY